MLIKKMPKTLKVSVDSREKKPLLFPETLVWNPVRGMDSVTMKIKIVKKTMPAGDYALEDWEHLALIERKGSIQELHQNLVTKDWVRQQKACDKLAAACAYPYILIEGHPVEMYRAALSPVKWGPANRAPIKPGYVIDRLMELTTDYGLGTIWGGTPKTASGRRILGEIVLRILLRHVAQYEPA